LGQIHHEQKVIIKRVLGPWTGPGKSLGAKFAHNLWFEQQDWPYTTL